MRIFADANVLVSAIAGPGESRRPLEIVRGSHVLLLSTKVIQETIQTLHEDFGIPAASIPYSVTGKSGNRPTFISSVAFRISDPDDLLILSAAVNGNADILCTRDRELLQLGGHLPFRILTPRQTLEVLLRT